MAMSASQVKLLLRQRGWKAVELAARWGYSATWISQLVNDPPARPAWWDDALRGLPERAGVEVVREARHQRRRKVSELWTIEQMYPAGRVYEALDSAYVEEGTRLVVVAVQRRASRAGMADAIYFRCVDAAPGEPLLDLTPELAAAHLHDTCTFEVGQG